MSGKSSQPSQDLKSQKRIKFDVRLKQEGIYQAISTTMMDLYDLEEEPENWVEWFKAAINEKFDEIIAIQKQDENDEGENEQQ